MEKTIQQSGNGANIGGTFEVVQKERKPHDPTLTLRNASIQLFQCQYPIYLLSTRATESVVVGHVNHQVLKPLEPTYNLRGGRESRCMD